MMNIKNTLKAADETKKKQEIDVVRAKENANGRQSVE